MSSYSKNHRSDRRKSGKSNSHSSKHSKAVEWSESMWDEASSQWYQYRYNDDGDLEYNYDINPSTGADGYLQDRGYSKNKEPTFGSQPTGCGQCYGCLSNNGSGCVKSTKFGELEQERRARDENPDSELSTVSPPKFPDPWAHHNQHSAPHYPSASSSYPTHYTAEDPLDRQQGYNVGDPVHYMASSSAATSSFPTGGMQGDNYTSRLSTSSYPSNALYTTNPSPSASSNTNQATYTATLSPSAMSIPAFFPGFQQLTIRQGGHDDTETSVHGYQGDSPRDSPSEISYGTVFGRICKEMGLLHEDYWGNSAHYNEPASYWNPEKLQNNCVFVSVGFLLGMDSKALSEYLQVEPLPKNLQGLNLGEIERILYRIPGINILTFPVQLQGSHIPRSQGPGSQQRFALRKLMNSVKDKGGAFAIGYQKSRHSGSGHCVVGQKYPGQDGSRVEHFRLTCFQNVTKGKDMSGDVKKSFISFAIFIDRGSRNRSVDCVYGSSSQSDGSQSYAPAYHTTIYDDGRSPTTLSYQLSSNS